MTSLILRVTSGFMMPGLVLFSIWVLLRGHDAPGGGFIGGLTAASGFALRVFACGADSARTSLRVHPRVLVGLGLLLSLLSGLAGLAAGEPFFQAYWLPELPVVGKLGTPVLFDFGVYLLVLGAVLASIFALSEAER